MRSPSKHTLSLQVETKVDGSFNFHTTPHCSSRREKGANGVHVSSLNTCLHLAAVRLDLFLPSGYRRSFWYAASRGRYSMTKVEVGGWEYRGQRAGNR